MAPKRIDLSSRQSAEDWEAGEPIRQLMKMLPGYFSSSEDEEGDSQVPKEEPVANPKKNRFGWYRAAIELANEKGKGKGASSGELVASASSGEPVASAEQQSSQATVEEFSAMSDDNPLKRKAQTQ